MYSGRFFVFVGPWTAPCHGSDHARAHIPIFRDYSDRRSLAVFSAQYLSYPSSFRPDRPRSISFDQLLYLRNMSMSTRRIVSLLSLDLSAAVELRPRRGKHHRMLLKDLNSARRIISRCLTMYQVNQV